MNLSNSDYVARIGNADSVRLVSITYELILAHIDSALHARGNESEYSKHLELSTELLGTLIDALNMDYELSRSLFPLYVYVNKLLITARISRKGESLLSDVQRILTPLHEAWAEVADTEKEITPAMDKSQTIYAGLTYGRGQLNEYISEDSAKSYRA